MNWSGCDQGCAKVSFLVLQHESNDDGQQVYWRCKSNYWSGFMANFKMLHDWFYSFVCPIFYFLSFISLHTYGQCCMRSSECSVLINVHVIYPSTVWFMWSQSSMDCILCYQCLVQQASGTTCTADAGQFPIIITAAPARSWSLPQLINL